MWLTILFFTQFIFLFYVIFSCFVLVWYNLNLGWFIGERRLSTFNSFHSYIPFGDAPEGWQHKFRAANQQTFS